MAFSLALAAVNVPLLKGILVFFGLFALLFGIMFFFSPNTIAKLSRLGNKILAQPRDSLDNNKVFGVFLVVFALVIAGILMAL